MRGRTLGNQPFSFERMWQLLIILQLVRLGIRSRSIVPDQDLAMLGCSQVSEDASKDVTFCESFDFERAEADDGRSRRPLRRPSVVQAADISK